MGTATLTEWDLATNAAASGGVVLTVDFDPRSLQLAYTPTGGAAGAAVADEGLRSKVPPQQTGQSTTLSLELTFDTSAAGTSVQERTDRLVVLTLPRDQPDRAPARRVVRFAWGSFLFVGTVTSMSQLLDFFSESGIPLRATIQLTLAEVRPPGPAAVSPSAPPRSGFGANASFSASASAGASLSGSASFAVGASASAGFSGGAAGGIAAGFSGGGSGGISGGVAAGAFAGARMGIDAAPVGTVALTATTGADTVAAVAARAGSGRSWKEIAAANGIDNPRLVPPGTLLDVHLTNRA